eukprot:CAMPEP_0172441628 /NCGR_PEP_ID=MMETSP1065-20121228/2149_1 /TAXON_ID=265537 /ORGANISM="Amphiprora paludosa, Strain CCMP125" /LENGTH=271 /DNA_ID=CAMNT_0013191083 /DNA_START=57 /DNA_END=869 /DNA_ORIENTATION=-
MVIYRQHSSLFSSTPWVLVLLMLPVLAHAQKGVGALSSLRGHQPRELEEHDMCAPYLVNHYKVYRKCLKWYNRGCDQEVVESEKCANIRKKFIQKSKLPDFPPVPPVEEDACGEYATCMTHYTSSGALSHPEDPGVFPALACEYHCTVRQCYNGKYQDHASCLESARGYALYLGGLGNLVNDNGTSELFAKMTGSVADSNQEWCMMLVAMNARKANVDIPDLADLSEACQEFEGTVPATAQDATYGTVEDYMISRLNCCYATSFAILLANW